MVYNKLLKEEKYKSQARNLDLRLHVRAYISPLILNVKKVL